MEEAGVPGENHAHYDICTFLLIGYFYQSSCSLAKTGSFIKREQDMQSQLLCNSIYVERSAIGK
jgi:hypothetical protein